MQVVGAVGGGEGTRPGVGESLETPAGGEKGAARGILHVATVRTHGQLH